MVLSAITPNALKTGFVNLASHSPMRAGMLIGALSFVALTYFKLENLVLEVRKGDNYSGWKPVSSSSPLSQKDLRLIERIKGRDVVGVKPYNALALTTYIATGILTSFLTKGSLTRMVFGSVVGGLAAYAIDGITIKQAPVPALNCVFDRCKAQQTG